MGWASAELRNRTIDCEIGLSLQWDSNASGGGLIGFFKQTFCTLHSWWTGLPISSMFAVSSSINSLQIEQIKNLCLRAKFERMGMGRPPW
jgi:hypothetical protein